MKLAACYNTWGDWELLTTSILNIMPVVDMVIVVHSKKSNYGEIDEGPFQWIDDPKVYYEQYEPTFHAAIHSETAKRNHGLQLARQAGATHYLSMDADEFYDQEEFLKAKQNFIDYPDCIRGMVCRSEVLFGSPELSIGLDTTLVPFIHKIYSDLKHEFNRTYPFAWDNSGIIRVDPTRSFNINEGVQMCDITMVHASWVRKDLESYKRKIRNSTARANLERSNILQDLSNAKEGYFCEFYRKPLVRVPNRFNIPFNGGLLDENLQSVAPASPENGA